MITIARLVEKKGLDDAIRACARLRDSGVCFFFQILGDGPQRAELERLAADLGLEDSIRFSGRVPNDRLRPMMSQAMVFVMPCVIARDGDRDGIPVAMMEAMASGVPVVSTTVSGIPELVEDGISGWLVPERSPELLAAALERTLKNPERAQACGLAGRARVAEEFDISMNAERLRRLIDRP